ncbi:MAG: hypothetical protein ACOC1F_05160, partial [Myxococcota bacterium]
RRAEGERSVGCPVRCPAKSRHGCVGATPTRPDAETTQIHICPTTPTYAPPGTQETKLENVG